MTQPAPPDPERGLRGIMSAILILEAIAILLALPVISHLGHHQGPVAITIICALAGVHILTCAVIGQRYAMGVIFVWQALLIACWVISGSLGVMGIVFTLVWVLVAYMRTEVRRRRAAGTLPPGR